MMIDKLRDFVNKSTPNINVGSLVINQDLKILAVSDVVTHWLNCKQEKLIRQKLTTIFPDIVQFESLFKHMIDNNDTRVRIQLSDIAQAVSKHPSHQQFQFEVQCAPRPGFLVLSVTTETQQQLLSETEQAVQERTAELAQANLLLEWENDRLRQQQKNRPQTGPLPSRYFPQIGFSTR